MPRYPYRVFFRRNEMPAFGFKTGAVFRLVF
jgi:hypothetical protein